MNTQLIIIENFSSVKYEPETLQTLRRGNFRGWQV